MDKQLCIWLSASSQLEAPLQRARGANTVLPPERAWNFRSFRFRLSQNNVPFETINSLKHDS